MRASLRKLNSCTIYKGENFLNLATIVSLLDLNKAIDFPLLYRCIINNTLMSS